MPADLVKNATGPQKNEFSKLVLYFTIKP